MSQLQGTNPWQMPGGANIPRRLPYYNQAFRNFCVAGAVLALVLTGMYAYFWNLVLKQPAATDGLAAENMGLGMISVITVGVFFFFVFQKQPYDVLREAGCLSFVLSSTISASMLRLYSNMASSKLPCKLWGPNGAGCWAIPCMGIIGLFLSVLLLILVVLVLSENYRGSTAPCRCLSAGFSSLCAQLLMPQQSQQPGQPPPYFATYSGNSATLHGGRFYSAERRHRAGVVQNAASVGLPPAYTASDTSVSASEAAAQNTWPVAPVYVANLPSQVQPSQQSTGTDTIARPAQFVVVQPPPTGHLAAVQPL